jgi:CheY-like chemotaxis protein
VRSLAAEILQRMGYRVLQAADGEEGVALLEAHRDAVRAVLLDMTMPKLDGEAAFRRVRSIRPDVPVIVVSGWTREHRRLRFLADEAGVAFLAKPFRLAQIQEAVRAAIGDG